MMPGGLPDPVAIAALVAHHFEQLGVRYVIGGSFASSMHGEPRSTNDIDIVADLSESQARRFAESLGSEFYVDGAAAVDATRSNASFNIIHTSTAVKVDVFVAGNDPLDQERLQRRRLATIDAGDRQQRLYVDTPEDVVLRKLEWFRRGDESSERQWRDVVAVLRVQHQLDARYLEAWAARLGIADLLSRAKDEADPLTI